MLTENEKKLIEAIVDAGLDEHISMCLPEGMSEEQMQEMTVFIRNCLNSNRKLTENDVTKKRLIILGIIKDE
ncbi:MAG: hypothetical protein IJ306_07135 [Oscillospiraceae bacterium]|nr:hypothetical protein [Oscillospiraceae bacterium]